MPKKVGVHAAGQKPGSVLIPAAVGTDKTALVPSNPRVANIAFRLRWNAETVIKRVEATLTSPVEQQLYLRVAGGYRIHPESLLKLLEVFRGARELQNADLTQVSIGKNLVTSRFDEILEKVEQALILLDKTDDGAEYMMSMTNAARLVEAYGDHSLEVFGELVENVARVAELLGIRTQSERRIVGVAIKTLVEEVLGKGCSTLPMTVEEMFGGREWGLHE
jgi:hypothetical protein